MVGLDGGMVWDGNKRGCELKVKEEGWKKYCEGDFVLALLYHREDLGLCKNMRILSVPGTI